MLLLLLVTPIYNYDNGFTVCLTRLKYVLLRGKFTLNIFTTFPPAFPDGPLIPDKLTTGPACIEGCKGRPDGDYQSCKACDVYATCSNEILYDERPCAYGKNNKQPVWDDEKKRCMWKTDTCSGPYPEGGMTELCSCLGTHH